MRKLCFLLFIFTLNILSQEQVKHTLSDYKLNGKVKVIKTLTYNTRRCYLENSKIIYKKNRLVDATFFGKNKTMVFNTLGNKTKERQFDNNKKTNQVTTYFYSKKPPYRLNSINYGSFIKLFHYDKEGNINEEIWCNNKNCQTQFINSFFYNRIMIRKTRIKDYLYEKKVYSYFNPLRKRSITATVNRKIKWKKEFTYNKNIVTKIKTNHKGDIEEKIITEFDTKKNVVERKSYFKIFSHDTYGIKYSYNKNSDIIKEIHYQLDYHNELKSNKSFWRSYNYTYDKHNNWTKCIIYQNYIPKFIVEREIHYY